jgi:myo-inositol-1(or 4)-monophosphatase
MPVAAVVHDPFTSRRWTAVRGQGAWCNGRPLTAPEAPRSLMVDVEGTGPSRWHPPGRSLMQAVADAGYATVRLLSFANGACQVASAGYAGAVFGRSSLHDTLAVALVAHEAGAVVSDLSGGPCLHAGLDDGLVVAHRAHHEALLEVVASFPAP